MALDLPAYLTARFSSDIWLRSDWRVRRDNRTDECRLLDPAGRVHRSGEAAFCIESGRRLAPSAGTRPAVILLHGLADGPRCLSRMAAHFAQAGWAVANVYYPSLTAPIAHHAENVRSIAAALREDGATEVAIIGHSLGGLVARQAMAAPDWPGRRAVLIGSPARGAMIADWLARADWFGRLAGAGGLACTMAGAAAIPIPDAEIMIIAGGTGGIGFNPLLAGDNDGIVTVAETRLGEAEAGFLRVPTLHALIQRHDTVIERTHAFLADRSIPRND